MRTNVAIDLNGINPLNGEDAEWWEKHCVYSRFRRQGIDIICDSFEQQKVSSKKPALANVILVTGWSESFLKYFELIKTLYDRGFSVFTYDHQSQGLSGRWLSESQSTYIHSFNDYVDDFVYFVTTFSRETNSRIPVFLIAHSMGGLIASIAMSRQPTLINRAVLCAPMLRNKCGMKVFDYRFPFPQPIAYWITWLSCYLGLGTMHSAGYFVERPADMLKLNITTTDQTQLDKWQQLRQRYPSIMSTCVTNDWVLHSIRAQKKFAEKYKLVQTNTLILCAEHDRFVHNRAMAFFLQKVPSCKMFFAPKACHELFFESDSIRGAAVKAVVDFFTQKSDDISLLTPSSPLELYDFQKRPIFTPIETAFRCAGLVVAAAGIIIGVTMILGGGGASNASKK